MTDQPPTAPITMTPDDLLLAIEHLHWAWEGCDKPPCPAIDLIDSTFIDADFMLGDQAKADAIVAEFEAACPGLIRAAEIYGRHIEAGQPDFDDPRFIRRLFAEHVGRDPFVQVS